MACAAAVLLLLTGCSAVNNPEQLAQSVQQTYAEASSVQTTVRIVADLGEETMTYDIEYDYAAQDGAPTAQMTVLAPESIKGITATISGEEYTFSYDGTVLETAMPQRKGLTPADAVTYLLDDLMHQTAQQVWMEDELLALRYEQQNDEGTTVKEVYVQPDTGALVQARIYREGEQILQCAFSVCTIGK